MEKEIINDNKVSNYYNLDKNILMFKDHVNKCSEFERSFIFNKETIHHEEKYFKFVTKEYDVLTENNKSTNKTTNKIKWECFYRTNIADYKSIYGSEVIALIKNNKDIISDNTCLKNFKVIIIENFRFPVERKVLEFPSGIIDDCEYTRLKEVYNEIKMSDEKEKFELIKKYNTILEHILIEAGRRELKEETGYSGKFKNFLTLPNCTNSISLFSNIFYDPWKSLENAGYSIFEVNIDEEINKNPIQDLDEAEIIKVHIVNLDELADFICNKIQNENYSCSTHLYTFALGLKFQEILNNF